MPKINCRIDRRLCATEYNDFGCHVLAARCHRDLETAAMCLRMANRIAFVRIPAPSPHCPQAVSLN
jgi:hypothetical protein